MSDPSVSVIIPALDATSVLAQQLDGLACQEITETWEVVVADNGSSDGTAALALQYQDRIPLRVVREERRGINYARNAGVAASTGAKILFTDADDIVGPRWVEAMAAAVRPDSIVGGWLDRRHLAPDDPRVLDPEPVSAIFQGEWLSYPIGCCMGWDRSLLAKIGGFDESLLYGADEVDAVWRSQLLGATVVQAEAEALLVRRERADIAALRRQSRTFGRAEAVMALRFASHGHPGRLRRRAAWRAAKAAAKIAVTKGPEALENRRKLAYHGAAARQILRYAARLDPHPAPADLVCERETDQPAESASDNASS